MSDLLNGSNLNSGFSAIGSPLLANVMQPTNKPTDNIEVNAAIRQSVQEFPPAINTGAFFVQTIPGTYLSPYGTKARDAELRRIFLLENNSLAQGTVSAIIKKFVTTPWEIVGNKKVPITIQGADGRLKKISAIEHFQLVFQNAQFGAGWEAYASRLLTDFFTQDFGGVTEIVGPGEPTRSLEGAVTGIAQLDSGRCFISGNPYYPLFYFSLISGSLHRMHASRVARFVDSPSPDERYFGIGLCALSRAISVVERQCQMVRYIYDRVNDQPTPGIMVWNGIPETKRNAMLQAYTREQRTDTQQMFGRILHISNINQDIPVKIDSLAFSQVPEKFDWKEYNSLDVDAMALAFNIDRQEIWELASRSLGSGQQSQILAEKASGKMMGFLYQNFERFANRRVLPDDFEFQFKAKDPTQEAQKAAQNQALAVTVQTLAAVPGVLTAQESREFLAGNSEEFKDVLATPEGVVEAFDAAQEGEDTDDVSLEDDNPRPPTQAVPQQPGSVQQAPNPPQMQQQPARKEFGLTSNYFSLKFMNLARRAVDTRIPRTQFENDLIDALSTAGTNAFMDGLRDGGINEPPDQDELGQIQDWLVDQIDYVDGLANDIYSKSIGHGDLDNRLALWINKSLEPIRQEGRIAADKNGYYKWQLGHTEKHCKDCLRLNGQIHRYKEWYSRGWLPKADQLECKGFKCDCSLVKTDEKAQGRF